MNQSFLDITRDVCPMTFVRTRLALDKLSSGDTLVILLCGEEPSRNVPRTLVEQGHTVLEQTAALNGIVTLRVLKKS